MKYWQKLALEGAAFLYGLFTLSMYFWYMLQHGALFARPSAKFKTELAAGMQKQLKTLSCKWLTCDCVARHKLWSLSGAPNGWRHHFHTLKDGLKLHYVTSEPIEANARNLIIFLHGFPDSWTMYKYHLLSDKLRENAVLVAMDLPGYGGSGETSNCDATSILEAISQFVLAMRDKYIHAGGDSPVEKGRVILVAHDWGGILAFRLASEAPQLADRFIIAAAVHVHVHSTPTHASDS